MIISFLCLTPLINCHIYIWRKIVSWVALYRHETFLTMKVSESMVFSIVVFAVHVLTYAEVTCMLPDHNMLLVACTSQSCLAPVAC